MVNHKRVYRLYKDEGLGLRQKRPKRRRLRPSSPQHAEGRLLAE